MEWPHHVVMSQGLQPVPQQGTFAEVVHAHDLPKVTRASP